MSTWQPCKQRDFIAKLRKLGFDPPEAGTRHLVMRYGRSKQVLPRNQEYSIPQLRKLLHQVEDKIGRTDTLEDVIRNYEHLNNSDPYQDMLFVEVDGQAAAYGRAEWNIDWEGNWVGFQICFSHPEFRRKGIGTVMMRYFEEHLHKIADKHLAEGKIKDDTSRYHE